MSSDLVHMQGGVQAAIGIYLEAISLVIFSQYMCTLITQVHYSAL